MTSSGHRLRSFIEARWMELGHPRYGMVTDLAKESGVLRNTMTAWFTRSSVPRLDALAAVAQVLQVTRAELVAAMDGDELLSADRAREIVRQELDYILVKDGQMVAGIEVKHPPRPTLVPTASERQLAAFVEEAGAREGARRDRHLEGASQQAPAPSPERPAPAK
jgi:transcriptional regulator with XRE-family HTH domain